MTKESQKAAGRKATLEAHKASERHLRDENTKLKTGERRRERIYNIANKILDVFLALLRR